MTVCAIESSNTIVWQCMWYYIQQCVAVYVNVYTYVHPGCCAAMRQCMALQKCAAERKAAWGSMAVVCDTHQTTVTLSMRDERRSIAM
jgi:glutamate/tyrosine decarboxylase-like PLP-dependent enzyme